MTRTESLLSAPIRLCVALLTMVFTGVPVEPAAAAVLDPPRDGWASWAVPAVADAPAWCCFDWDGKRRSEGRCDLDARSGGYGSRDQDAPVDTMRIYAKFDGGTLARIRALSPTCPVESKTAIADLGAVDADDSVRWLQQQLASSRDRGSDVLAALSVHAGPAARDALAMAARVGDDVEIRKNAVFWMGQVRASDSAEILRSIMFDDADAIVREHAAFSLSQSSIPETGVDLIRLGNTDRTADVRARAWFWLAQTGDPDSESAIADAMRREKDDEVREQAIFALSQLPDDRSVDALGAIVGDPARPSEDRKRALFWLGQSDSPRAQDYLSKVLAGR